MRSGLLSLLHVLRHLWFMRDSDGITRESFGSNSIRKELGVRLCHHRHNEARCKTQLGVRQMYCVLCGATLIRPMLSPASPI